ncbi:MAG: hypothetical protein ACRDUA_02350 [Micromonosporaceae bacterium]
MTEREQNRAAAEAFAKGDIEFDYGSASGAELPPPPSSEVMVTKSVKWPPELYRQITTAAAGRGQTVSQFIRDCVAAELTVLGDDKPISLADAVRALAALRPAGN